MQNVAQRWIVHPFRDLCLSKPIVLLLVGIIAQIPSLAFSQQTDDFPGSKLLGTAEYGFKIEPGIVTVPEDMRVRTLDNEGNAVIAKVHCKVGDNYVVLLPDGQLVDRFAKDVSVTDDKFVALKGRDLAEKLASGRLDGFKYKASGKYVFIYNTTEPFFQVTERILNTMYRGVKSHAEKAKKSMSMIQMSLWWSSCLTKNPNSKNINPCHGVCWHTTTWLPITLFCMKNLFLPTPVETLLKHN